MTQTILDIPKLSLTYLLIEAKYVLDSLERSYNLNYKGHLQVKTFRGCVWQWEE